MGSKDNKNKKIEGIIRGKSFAIDDTFEMAPRSEAGRDKESEKPAGQSEDDKRG